MDKIKSELTNRMVDLGNVKFPKPTAMDLHSKRPLMGRVQRQEDRSYKQKIEKQKRDSKLKLERIQKYVTDLKAEEIRRLKVLESLDTKDSLYVAPIFQPIELVVPKPVIGMVGMSQRRMTRLSSRRR